MGPICCPKTSVWNYYSVLHKIPKGRRPQWCCGGSLQSCTQLYSTLPANWQYYWAPTCLGGTGCFYSAGWGISFQKKLRPHMRYTYSGYCILEQFTGFANGELLGLAFCLLTLVSPPFQQTFLVSWTVGDAFELTPQQCLLHAQSIRRGICGRLLREATGAIFRALDAYLVTRR